MKKRYIVLATLGALSAIGAGLVLHKHKKVEEPKELYFPPNPVERAKRSKNSGYVSQ